MPLPANGTPWPPKEWAPIFGQMSVWDAWWTGDTNKLSNVYANGAASQQSHGVRGKIQKFFHGRRNNDASRPSRSDLHIPIASDLAATNADLVYGKPPQIESDHGLEAETSKRITQYMEDGLLTQLLEGAETGSAFGGRYHQIIIDPDLVSMPFVSTIHADHALPEFRWGRLVAVTFWTVIEQDNSIVWRHVERHELRGRFGVTLHGLYKGNSSNLGQRVSLGDHPTTAGLKTDADGVLTTIATPGLSVVYIPNITPQRRWRTDPKGRDLGRSDLDGLEGMMDAVDEVYSSWMRDIRQGKARLLVDRTMLEAPVVSTPGNPTGAANTFDLDKEVYVPVNGVPGKAGEGKFIQSEQFNIRVQEHADTVNDLIKRIIRAARWSTASFDDTTSANMTATEVRARQNTTETTRDRKIRLEQAGLLQLVRKMLTLDSALFGTKGLVPDNVTIKFPDLIKASAKEAAETASLLKQAEIASLETAVQMAHPDWDSEQVGKEVKRIEDRQPLIDPSQWRPEFGDDDEQEPPETE